MTDPGSVQHDRIAGILADLEANPHALVQEVDTELWPDDYGRVSIELVVAPSREEATDE